jgi:hypothetical protein
MHGLSSLCVDGQAEQATTSQAGGLLERAMHTYLDKPRVRDSGGGRSPVYGFLRQSFLAWSGGLACMRLS